MTTAVATDGVVDEARYILADVAANSNKFWTITLHADNTCVTAWGRVGETGSRKEFPFPTADEARRFFEQKRREKERKGYAPQRTLGGTMGSSGGRASARVAQCAIEQIETDCAETRRLVARLARANVHDILAQTSLQYDESRGTFSTPLGVVTEDAIVEARGLLSDLAGMVRQDQQEARAFARALSEYLMLIPQDIGRARPDPRALFPDLDAVQKQNALLDGLEASLKLVLAQPDGAEPLQAPTLFEAKLRAVGDADLLARIRKLYAATAQTRHVCAHLGVAGAYEVEIAAMRRAFEKRGPRVGNVKLLWHGTRTGNLLSLLKSGFVIPPANAAHVTGRMFGNGIYFSDQSTKSLNYAYGYWGGARDERCYMLLCDVAMGRSWTPPGPTNWHPHWPYHSLCAKAGASGVLNNEMVVYDAAQVNPRYLVEFAPQAA